MNLCTCIQAESDGTLILSPRTQPERDGLVPIDESPFIGETPIVSLQTWLTPNPNFYVRNHFSTPTDIPSSWNLVVDGHVEQTLDLSLGDFRCLPKQTLPITMECAGNNRSDLQPKVPGNPFQSGAVSTPQRIDVPLELPNERVPEVLEQYAAYPLQLELTGGRKRISVGVRDELARIDATVNVEVLRYGLGTTEYGKTR